jgi:hypothetical protein
MTKKMQHPQRAPRLHLNLHLRKSSVSQLPFPPRKAPRFSPAGKSPQKPKKHENCTKSRTANKRICFEDAVENYDDLA